VPHNALANTEEIQLVGTTTLSKRSLILRVSFVKSRGFADSYIPFGHVRTGWSTGANKSADHPKLLRKEEVDRLEALEW